LIVKASGGQLKAVQGVVEKLDLRRAQVYVETIIAEVSVDKDAEFGFEWSGGEPLPATTTTGSLLPGDSTRNLAFNGSGLTYSVLNAGSDQLNLIVNALRSDTNSNILSTPTILTLDNETAEIVVGQEVPFVTGTFNNGFSNNNPNGGVGSNNFQTIERRDVGIKLQIKPQISEGDTIQLEVLQEISSVSETAVAGQADLITNRRSIEAVVQVDDGQVIVLGGLLEDNVTDVVVGVPFLSRIPLIGQLFRSTTKNTEKSNLMVFLKPHIIRSADELAKYSKNKYERSRHDGLSSRKGSSKLLVPEARPAVLDKYENVIGDGELGTVEAKKRFEKQQEKERKRLKKQAAKQARQKNKEIDDTAGN